MTASPRRQAAALAAALVLAGATGAAAASGHLAVALALALALAALVLTGGRPVGRVLRDGAESRARLEAEVAARTAQLGATVARLEVARNHLGVTDRLAAVGRLAAGLAHEINSPLAVLLTNLGWLREAGGGAAPSERAEAVAEAEAAGQRIALIVRDVQDFAQERRGAPGAADLIQVLHHVERLVAHQVLPRARLRLELPDGPLPVTGSAARLGQLFAHLLLHAAEAVEEGHADANEVLLLVRVEGATAVVEVHDTGPGLTPDELAHVFDPFYGAWSDDQQGGLGLAVCHGLASALGGTITAESAPGRGSLYRVRLPAAARDARLALSPAPPRRPRVLVVDDEPLVCASIYRVLSRHFDVAPHTSPGHALQLLLAGERFDVVLCDLMMPEMNGAAFHAELARIDPRLAEQAIFLTGGAFTPQAREFLERVPNARLHKPFDPAELLALVAARCGAPSPPPPPPG